ncbi:MAG: SOS response-associated peptidase [Methylococcales bacterium]|nr:SOS response-associated peptidase [Methylococcales bacterium]
MCGRFALYSDAFTLSKRFGVHMPPELRPHYNMAPSQNILIMRQEEGKRSFALARWGLIPHWAKDMKIGYSMINARAETVADKPAFRAAFRYRRCLIPANGFYEWQVIPGSKNKQPWFVTLKDRESMAFAGLWERWRSPEGEELESCTIIVTEANGLMRPIHDRMPVILAPADWDAWLGLEDKDAEYLQNLLKPYPTEKLKAWPVSTKVNNPRDDSVECIEKFE